MNRFVLNILYPFVRVFFELWIRNAGPIPLLGIVRSERVMHWMTCNFNTHEWQHELSSPIYDSGWLRRDGERWFFQDYIFETMMALPSWCVPSFSDGQFVSIWLKYDTEGEEIQSVYRIAKDEPPPNVYLSGGCS